MARADEKPAGADPALDPDTADDADAHAHPEEFETRPPDIVEVEWQLPRSAPISTRTIPATGSG
jgi:hypothetical protein